MLEAVQLEETFTLDPVTKLLKDCYSQKRSINPAFSLRSYARTLQIDQAYLIRVLKGARTPSPQIAYKIAQHLGLSHQETLDLIVSTFK